MGNIPPELSLGSQSSTHPDSQQVSAFSRLNKSCQTENSLGPAVSTYANEFYRRYPSPGAVAARGNPEIVEMIRPVEQFGDLDSKIVQSEDESRRRLPELSLLDSAEAKLMDSDYSSAPISPGTARTLKPEKTVISHGRKWSDSAPSLMMRNRVLLKTGKGKDLASSPKGGATERNGNPKIMLWDTGMNKAFRAPPEPHKSRPSPKSNLVLSKASPVSTLRNQRPSPSLSTIRKKPESAVSIPTKSSTSHISAVYLPSSKSLRSSCTSLLSQIPKHVTVSLTQINQKTELNPSKTTPKDDQSKPKPGLISPESGFNLVARYRKTAETAEIPVSESTLFSPPPRKQSGHSGSESEKAFSEQVQTWTNSPGKGQATMQDLETVEKESIRRQFGRSKMMGEGKQLKILSMSPKGERLRSPKAFDRYQLYSAEDQRLIPGLNLSEIAMKENQSISFEKEAQTVGYKPSEDDFVLQQDLSIPM